MKPRICVCGLGKLGRPILELMRLKGFEAVGYDAIPKLSEISLSDAVDQSDAAIFIVPTPSQPDGSFSNTHLTEALIRFKLSIPMRTKPDYLYIISSTTTPGSCEEFRLIVGNNLVYKPEFIRLAHVTNDLLNQSIILLGESTREAGERAFQIFRQVTDAAAHRMTLTEAELAKITLNCALTMKISLANQLHMVAEKMGCNSDRIMLAVGADPRIGHAYLKPGAAFAGPCLPRDNRMFQFVAERVGVEARLSQAADFINEAISQKM